MPSRLATPGVYIEEISKFPPSVAQVETAIPAFIGYTGKAKEINVPKKIASLLDFVVHFGSAPDVNISAVNLSANLEVNSADVQDNYYMYESLRMFFANGGGECYIVPVGVYGDTVENGDGTTAGFLKGLKVIEKVDQPTLLVIPDAVLMDQSHIDSLYKQMLMQCDDLQDRFCIFDTKKNNKSDFDQKIQDFRDGIGMGNLKYGAVYAPWLQTNLPRAIYYKDIKGKIKVSGNPKELADLTNDSNATIIANRLDNLIDDQNTIATAIDTLKGTYSSVDSKFNSLLNDLVLSPDKPELKALLDYYVQSIDLVRDVIDKAGTDTIQLKDRDNTDTKYLFGYLKDKLDASLDVTINEVARIDLQRSNLGGAAAVNLIASTTGVDYSTTTSTNNYFDVGANNADKIKVHINEFAKHWGAIKSSIDLIVTEADSFVRTLEKSAVKEIPVLKNIFNHIASEYITLPPSGTMAGVYARVDSDRGVWKAPANVSLNNVVAVTQLIGHKEQENLNIDTLAGKSVNAIRPFTGKGIMVWGARTLAGNDNEWRYISVRRFFNMVEESVKNAAEAFVFEANDANTWVRIKSMIDNFLTNQWRAGALAGAKADDAFYVKVGLNQTMTAQDILNGIMNIEIGMAVVRPAEFIVLKFSHKMQES